MSKQLLVIVTVIVLSTILLASFTRHASSDENQVPFGGTPWPVPGVIQAEDYDLGGEGIAYHDYDPQNWGQWYRPDEGVDITGIPHAVGWADPSEWVEYTVNIADSANYDIELDYWAYDGHAPEMSFLVDGSDVTESFPLMGEGVNVWLTAIIPNVALPAGTHVLRIDFDGNVVLDKMTFSSVAGGQTPTPVPTTTAEPPTPTQTTTPVPPTPTQTTTPVPPTETPVPPTPTPVPDQFPFGGIPWPIPGRIQLEDFDEGGEGIAYHDSNPQNIGATYRLDEGVDIRSDVISVGWTGTGEWLEYTVDIAESTTYDLMVRVRRTIQFTDRTYPELSISLNGSPLVETIDLTANGSDFWSIKLVEGIDLPAGQHVVKLTFVGNTIIDWFEFVAQEPTSSMVELYDVYELIVDHDSSTYANPYNLDEIELTTTYMAPGGRQIAFWGFHDGDGQGGINGNVWKARFMPDEVGTWQVNWQFSDSSASGSETFLVTDTGIQSGSLQRDGRFFKDARGNALDACGYGMIVWEAQPGYADNYDYIAAQADWLQDNGFNLIQVSGLKPLSPYSGRTLNPAHWHPYENMLLALQDRGIYSFHFRYLDQGQLAGISDADLTHWQRTRIARLGAFWTDVGVTPSYEWPEFMAAHRMSEIQQQYANLDPFPRLLTAHDSSRAEFASWLGFSSRQAGAVGLFTNHSRTAGQHGGVEASVADWPIVGSEDLWYQSPFGQPQTVDEIRQGVWNEMLAGVIPVLSTWHWVMQQPTPDDMLAQYQIACDFVLDETNYREWDIRFDWQSDSQIVSSSSDDSEYIVYTLDGSAELPTGSFDLTWLNPLTGETTVQNDVFVSGSVSSPLSGNEVVLLANRNN